MRLIDANALEKIIKKEQDKLEENVNLWNINKPIWKGLAYTRRMVIDAPTIDPMTCLVCENCIHFEGSIENSREQGRCKKFSAWKYAFEPHCSSYCPNYSAEMNKQ